MKMRLQIESRDVWVREKNKIWKRDCERERDYEREMNGQGKRIEEKQKVERQRESERRMNERKCKGISMKMRATKRFLNSFHLKFLQDLYFLWHSFQGVNERRNQRDDNKIHIRRK